MAIGEWVAVMIAGFGLGLLLATVVYRRRRSREHGRAAPQRGDRPEVKLLHDGLTYDLTDELQRIADNDKGQAVWAVHAPQHLRFPASMVTVPLTTTIVPDTSLRLFMRAFADDQQQMWMRFATPEEITEELSGEHA